MRSQTFKLWMLCPVVAAGFLSTAAQAQDTFRVYAGVAPTSYSIAFSGSAPAGYSGKTAKSSYTAGNLGFSWVLPQRIYFDLSYQQSLSADHDLWKDTNAANASKQDFSNNAFTLTGGYINVLPNGMSITGFGGLRKSESTLSAPKNAFSSAGVFIQWSKEFFDSTGAFVGAGAAVPALAGQFSVSGAVAFLSGTWKDDIGNSTKADHASGYSLNGGYTYQFTQALGITADLRYQVYNFAFKRSQFFSFAAVPYDVTEKTISGGLRLSYQF
jgi:hypothetical protein